MTEVVGVILAGGLARRMGGGDKCRLRIDGRSVLDRTIEALRPQVSALALNANGDLARFADVGLPVLADTVPGHPGPLAGVLAGLDWAAGLGADWLLSAPGDCPYLPGDMVARFRAERGGAEFVVAASGGRTHPVAGLWPMVCRDTLRASLGAGERKIDAFTGRFRTATVEWPTEPADPFLNLNTPEDVAALEGSASGARRI